MFWSVSVFVYADTYTVFRTVSRDESLVSRDETLVSREGGNLHLSGTVRAVLTQLQDGMWRVISYASRNLTDMERRYSQTEREGLALVLACERFKLYVYGREFETSEAHL